MATLFIPALLRTHTEGRETVIVPGATLRDVVRNLDVAYPGLGARLFDSRGDVQDGLVVAIDGVTSHLGLLEKLADDSEVHFIPAIGGGRCEETRDSFHPQGNIVEVHCAADIQGEAVVVLERDMRARRRLEDRMADRVRQLAPSAVRRVFDHVKNFGARAG
jgi:molybdopterin synthase sulfur carrier subunit